MQLCDATLHDWLRYRDLSIIQESSHERKNIFHSLNDLGQRQCWHIFKQLLDAVQYLHSQSFVHRDIKPRNIFLAYDSKDESSVHVKLGDFGLATLLDSQPVQDSSERPEPCRSFGVGTALYASPEQLNSRHSSATAKSDSYSLGVVLFELFHIFGTEMERSICIDHLRTHMKVEDQFLACYPLETEIIEQLVLIDSDKRLSIKELLVTYSKEIQRKTMRQKSYNKQNIIDQLQEKVENQDKRIKQLELELRKNKLRLETMSPD